MSDAEAFAAIKEHWLQVWVRESSYGCYEWGVSDKSGWVQATGPSLNLCVEEFLKEVLCVRCPVVE